VHAHDSNPSYLCERSRRSRRNKYILSK